MGETDNHMGNLMKDSIEWDGHVIEVVHSVEGIATSRLDLRVDGASKDFLKGKEIKKGAILKATTSDGNKVCAEIRPNLLAVSVKIKYNDREVKSFVLM